MAVEPLPAARSADLAFSDLDRMQRIKAAPHTDDDPTGCQGQPRVLRHSCRSSSQIGLWPAFFLDKPL